MVELSAELLSQEIDPRAVHLSQQHKNFLVKKESNRIEYGTFRSGRECSIHCAMPPPSPNIVIALQLQIKPLKLNQKTRIFSHF